MIHIRDYDSICQDFVTTIGQLDTYKLVATDPQAVNRLVGTKGNILIAVIPESDTTGRPGRTIDANSALFYIVTKQAPSLTPEQELTAYATTQDIILAIRDTIIDRQAQGCSHFSRLQPETIHITPEYNIFGGFLGWSMIFIF